MLLALESISKRLKEYKMALKKLDNHVKAITNRVNESGAQLRKIQTEVYEAETLALIELDQRIACRGCGNLLDPQDIKNDDDLCLNCIEKILYGKSFQLEKELSREESARDQSS